MFSLCLLKLIFVLVLYILVWVLGELMVVSFCKRFVLLVFTCVSSLKAQAPILQDSSVAIHQKWLDSATRSADQAAVVSDGCSTQVGMVAMGRAGDDRSPLIDGVGLGTALSGSGIAVQAEQKAAGWFVGGTVVTLREMPLHPVRLVFQEGGLGYQSKGGWRFALEQRPFDWGFGLTGGYLGGTSYRPFSRLALETPWTKLQFLGCSLGRWRAETYLGRLEWDRRIQEWASNPMQQANLEKNNGDIRRPNISGFMLRGTFGENIDLNLGLMSLWGGVRRNGERATSGYSVKDYALAYFGAENIAEVESSEHNGQFDNLSEFKAISDAIALVEIKARMPELANHLGANGMFVYLSRGAENVNWQWQNFFHDPIGSIAYDFRHDIRQIKKGWHGVSGGEDSILTWSKHQAAPSMDHPNDKAGIQMVWSGWNLGVEYSDTCTIAGIGNDGGGYRTYSHSSYLSGFSRDGDCIGMAFGGDTIARSVVVGMPLPFAGSGNLRLTDGIREFRDSEALWHAAWGNVDPVNLRFFHAQMEAAWAWGVHRLGFAVSRMWVRNALFQSGARSTGASFALSYSLRVD